MRDLTIDASAAREAAQVVLLLDITGSMVDKTVHRTMLQNQCMKDEAGAAGGTRRLRSGRARQSSLVARPPLALGGSPLSSGAAELLGSLPGLA